VPVDQRVQPVPAGDQHRAGRRAGQQRCDLVAGDGVVQHDEHPPPGDQGAVELGFGVEVGGDAVRVDAQGVEEPAHRNRRLHRFVGGAEAVQVDEQLPVGKPLQMPICPGQGERGLADAPGTADRRDQHRRPRTCRAGGWGCGGPLPRVGAWSLRGSGVGQGAVQAGQLRGPAGEQTRCGR
jgi:hypothetical protein